MAINTGLYDPEKMLSLKLACLPWRDRFWIMSRLPSEQRKRLKKSVKFVKSLGRPTIEALLAGAIEAQQAKECLLGDKLSEVAEPQASYSHIQCPVLKSQVQKIHCHEVTVTDSVRRMLMEMSEHTVNTALAGDKHASH
ncbi:hypothetical protein KIH87_12815 [Paraneptunicella aestuarii]|uniref:hypothetical protein n=1 Tax=Paraneptunicella aestuarii TaxID=2831148 RepID=UPI001E2D45FF|nr:hypothetical protein [Paraneptunicella aestuarii]UAA37591.1 hypothetical protein KIH87_12815 [Paraneptunicella aestuarii]